MMRRFRRQLGMRQKPERPDAIAECNNDYSPARESIAPIERHGGGTVEEAAAIDPDDHRQVFRLRRRPDVEVKTVLAGCGWRLARHGDTGLHAGRRECPGIANA